jgi:predicted acetyltransferase
MGIFTYWVGIIDNDPFCFILTAEVNKNENHPQVWLDNISKTGTTYSIDFGIGNTKYLGKGLASPTLKMFAKFFHEKIDPSADTFFIDPGKNNPRAIHVYKKAGFKMVGSFISTEGVFKEQQSYLMVKHIFSMVKLTKATIDDYPTIQNMARFYVYDMSRYCGFISDEWEFPKNGLYESHDFKKYFIDKTREAFLVKIEDELAGFVLLNKTGALPDTEWNMGEFFIIAKFQGKGIAREIANQIWKTHPGKWEVSVIPENERALIFWRKTINHFTEGNYQEAIKDIDYDKSQPKRYILSFDANE